MVVLIVANQILSCSHVMNLIAGKKQYAEHQQKMAIGLPVENIDRRGLRVKTPQANRDRCVGVADCINGGSNLSSGATSQYAQSAISYRWLIPLILLFTLFCVALAHAEYTTDAHITPDELLQWPAVHVSLPNNEGLYAIVAENPFLRTPIDCQIKYIFCIVHYITSIMLGYSYYIEDELFVYELFDDHYSRVEAIPRKKKTIDSYLFHFLGRERL